MSIIIIIRLILLIQIYIIRQILCDTCQLDGCISCPHGQEVCYKCSTSYVFINYNCLPIESQDNNSYYQVVDPIDSSISYSEICPEETHYIQDSDTVSKCLPCPKECDGCYISNNKVKCWDCAQGYYMNNSINYEEKNRYDSINYNPSCIKTTNSQTPIELQITITVADINPIQLNAQNCQGLFSIGSLFKALIFLEKYCAPIYSEGNLNIVFEDGTHFVMIDHPDYLNSNRVFEFFRSTNYIITFGSTSSKTQCKIYWRTEQIRMYIWNTITIQDITIDGSENKARLNSDATLKSCFSTRDVCCNSQQGHKYICDDNTSYRQYKDNSSSNLEPDALGQGIFNILASKRYDKDFFPVFTIQRVDILSMMMYSAEQNRYFLKISGNYAFISLNALNVDKYYFTGGLISNYKYASPKRGSTLYVDQDIGLQRRSDCRMQIKSIVQMTYCLQIYITSSTFQNYNYFKYQRIFDGYNNDAKYTESFTLNLYSTLTSLTIDKSKFLRGIVSSYMRDNIKEHFISSKVMQCKNNYDDSSESDLLKTSFIKTDPNLHFDQDQISQYTQKLGSHIVWQYFKGTIKLTNSIFDSNISYQSPCISIIEYSQYMGSSLKPDYMFINSNSELAYVGNAVIYLSGNQFSNNFAFVGNSVMQFYQNRKYEFNKDYMTCMAMKFYNNTFINNLGCPTSYFVVSINCRFSGLASDQSNPKWYMNLNPTNLQKENDELLTQVVFKSNKFTSNYAIISNSLFINGARDILIQDNIFQENGILTQRTQGQILSNNSPYMSINGYNNVTYPYFNEKWMTESTSLFLQFPVSIQITANQFLANWAISSGDSYIGQSFMMHRILSVTDIKLYNNIFSNHVGVPSKFLKTDEIGKSYSTLPVLSFHFYTQTQLKRTIIQPIQIDFYQNTFENNMYKIDIQNKDLLNSKLDSYTLYSNGGSVQLIKLFTDNEINGSQPVSTDYLNMLPIKINFLIRNSIFNNNTHLNGGCMMEVSGVNYVQAQGNTFKGNDNDYKQGSASSSQIGAKICLLKSSPVTLAVPADNEPKLNIISQNVNADKGPFLFQEIDNSFQEIGDMTFTDCTSTTFIFQTFNVNVMNMEGNQFTNCIGMQGMISIIKGQSVYLKDLTITKSFPYGVYMESIQDYTMNGLNMLNNDSNLYASFVKATFINVSQYNNFIKNNVYGMYIYRSRGQMSDSLFDSNIVSSGAISLLRDNSAMQVSNIVAQNNYAMNVGGVFYITDESDIDVTSCKFYNNTSEQNGGCLFVQNSYMSIISSNITLCKSQMSSGVGRIEQSNILIKSSLFLNNTAVDEASLFHSIRSNMDIQSSNFVNNTARACGIIASSVKIKINNSKFLGNSAQSKTKNIYLTQSTLLLENSIFKDYTPINQVTGSFLQVFKSVSVIKQSQFLNGLAAYGGAIMVEIFSQVQIESSLFQNNYAQQSGGGIASSSYLNIQSTNFTKNSALINGNDIYFKCQDDLILKSILILPSLGKSIFVWGRKFSAFNLHIIGDPALKKQDTDEMKGIYAFQTKNVEISESKLENLFAIKGGGMHIINEINVEVINTSIKNSFFNNNQAMRGGGLYVDGLTNTEILDSTFQQNIAYYFNDTIGTGNGGGIYYSCPLSFSLCQLSVTRSNFLNNQAEMEGGALKFDQSEIKIDYATQFTGNYAIYGPDVASYPIHLFKTSSLEQESISDFKNPEAFENGFSQLVQDSYDFTDQVSGQKMNLIYALTDHYGNVVKTANSSYARFSTENESIYLEAGERVSVNGYFDFSNFVVTINPGDYLHMFIHTDAIPEEWLQKARDSQLLLSSRRNRNLQTTDNSKPSKGSVPVSLEFRKCKLGEVQDANKCIPCGNNKYSNQVNVTEGSAQCKECLENSICLGQNEVAPIPGFWRLTEISENILACPNPGACLGGYLNDTITSENGICNTGYDGILCMECTDGYARYGDSECVECQNNIIYDIRAVITCFITITMISLGIKNQLEEDGTEKVHTISLLKIFGNFSQTISIISLFSIQFPSSVNSVTSVNNQYFSAPLQVFSMDCYFTGFGVSTTLVRVFITIVTPLFVMLSSVVFFCIFYAIKEGTKLFTDKQNQINAIIVTQLVIIFIFHPEIVTASFSLFQCQNLGDSDNPAYYSQIEPQLKCFEGEHLLWIKYLGTPSLILWVFIIPFMMVVVLWRFRDIIDRPDIVKTYGFITKGYRAEYYYWEIIIMYRKSILVIGSIFMNFSPFISGLNILLYLFFWLMVQIKCQPFLTNQLNQIEEYSLLTSLFYIYFSLYFIVNESNGIVNIVMIILLLITYGGYHIYFILVYGRERLVEFTETLTNINEDVKHPLLVRIFGKLAEVKPLACLRKWFLEQKQLVENAINAQRIKNQAKLDSEIQNYQSSKIIKQQIKDAIKEDQKLALSYEDEFLTMKRKNKEITLISQRFNQIMKNNAQPKVDVNKMLKQIAFKNKNVVANQIKEEQEEKQPLKANLDELNNNIKCFKTQYDDNDNEDFHENAKCHGDDDVLMTELKTEEN